MKTAYRPCPICDNQLVESLHTQKFIHGKKLHGSPIIRPQELGVWGDTLILIATLLHHHVIARQIREMGLNNETVFLQGDI